MALSKDEIFELAREAVREMAQQNDPEHRFPPDVIWQHLPPGVVIPGPSKPSHAKRLVKEGYLELTGNKTKALSEQRAGSTTNEYRFGPRLVSRAPVVPPARPATPTALWDTAPIEGASDSLKKIQALMESEGYVISVAELANFFLAMAVSPLVILSGISGTGKSLLPRKFAKRTGAMFHAIPVQPQWESNSDLFGYVPTLATAKYVKGALIDGLLGARNNPGKLVIALLDEMNLAPVEHYFSDFLSVAETRYREGTSIVTDPLPIELPMIVDGVADEQANLRGIRLPPNLRVVGTANMDETTHTFSPKVLDRAFTIEFDDPDLTSFASGGATSADTFEALGKFVIAETNAISVQESRESSQDLFDHVAGMLAEIQEILSPAGIKFGYRTRDAILMYLHFWRECALGDIMTGSAALDFCILQKVLPKISGSGDGLEESLKSLTAWLETHSEIEGEEMSDIEKEFAGPLARSQQKIERMRKILDLDGATRFWGA